MNPVGADNAEPPGARLRDVCTALTGPLVELVAAPAGLDVVARDVVIREAGDDPQDRAGALVLLIGVRGRNAVAELRAAADAGAVAVAVKTTGEPGELDALREAATVALLTVAPEARWEQVEALIRGLVDSTSAAIGLADGDPHGDLFALAQTVATLTGGIVSVEDASSRVLAYSRSDDEVDELRRLSILGRACPEPYLAVLRKWGVFQRIRAGEEVVEVEEHPELGVRRRLVIGIHAGGRALGSIWVQEGTQELAGRAEHVLRGAARLAALNLVRQRGDSSLGAALRQDLAAGLLDGRIQAAAFAGHVGVDPDAPALVVALDLRESGTDQQGHRELNRAQAAGIVAVHAAAYRRNAVVTELGGRIYVVLPDVSAPGTGWTTDLVAAVRRDLSNRAQAAIADVVPALSGVPAARRDADRILDALARDPDRLVATLADVRPAVLLADVLALLRTHEEIRDPALDALVAYDERHGTELAESLLLYLDAFGDVAAVAERLHVHPNTLRHRLRRITSLTGFDADDPEQRLLAMLQLRLR